MQETTREVLEKDPVLLVATHPRLVDVAGVIGALPPERKDVFILGNSLYLGLGENAAQHVIPVYGVVQQHTENVRSRLWRQTGFEPQPPPRLETARLNIKSLKTAIQKIENGAMVVVFPDGSREEDGSWFTGVGELVKSLKGHPQAKIVLAMAKGGRTRDNFRFFPKASQVLGQTDIKVKFSEPHKVDEYLPDQNTRQSITQQLRNQYYSFSSSR